MIYLDSSAVLKLVFEERESHALADWLTARTGVPLVSSELTRVEVLRTCLRLDPGAVPAAGLVLAALDLVPLQRPLLDSASALPDPALRTLDALHLASALCLGSALSVLVAYDVRLLRAAAAAGATTAQPGA